MAINVTALNNYVEEKRLPLIAKSFLRGKTIDLIQIETGVLQDTALNLVSASVEFGDGASCGWNATDGIALSQRLLKPTFLKVNQAFCDKDLLKRSLWKRLLMQSMNLLKNLYGRVIQVILMNQMVS